VLAAIGRLLGYKPYVPYPYPLAVDRSTWSNSTSVSAGR